MNLPPPQKAGFTLIELSIVLVIIGLIIGGVLVGQDLIKAAEIRATVAQIEKYNTAAHTFQTKYGYLPGDIPANSVTQFGFGAAPTRAGTQGRGDGNGSIEGYSYPGSTVLGYLQTGETAFFWEDLSTNSNMISDALNTATDAAPSATITGTNVTNYLPYAKLGGGNFVLAYSFAGRNYFSILGVASITTSGNPSFTENMSVAQAYVMDSKVDDGLPVSGNVQAVLFASTLQYAPHATSPNISTCFDTTSSQYSMSINNGANTNCGLSFRMQ